MTERINKKIAIIILLTLCFRFTSIPYVVSGESMEPTLHNKDFGIAVRTNFISIDRFDIVVVKQDGKYLIKRVIGLPGEHIKCVSSSIYINDSEIRDKYAMGVTGNFDYKLNENEYFCLGDNREHSSDSRYYGAFKLSSIIAKVL